MIQFTCSCVVFFFGVDFGSPPVVTPPPLIAFAVIIVSESLSLKLLSVKTVVTFFLFNSLLFCTFFAKLLAALCVSTDVGLGAFVNLFPSNTWGINSVEQSVSEASSLSPLSNFLCSSILLVLPLTSSTWDCLFTMHCCLSVKKMHFSINHDKIYLVSMKRKCSSIDGCIFLQAVERLARKPSHYSWISDQFDSRHMPNIHYCPAHACTVPCNWELDNVEVTFTINFIKYVFPGWWRW